jgi:hypothetical protein
VAEGFGMPVEETQLNRYVGFGQIGDVPSSDNLKKLQKTNTLTGYLNSDIFPYLSLKIYSIFSKFVT